MSIIGWLIALVRVPTSPGERICTVLIIANALMRTRTPAIPADYWDTPGYEYY